MALALVDGSVDSTVNNPIEAVTIWKEGELRPLCVFDSKPLQYLMLRGVVTTPGASPEQVAYYVDVLKKVRDTSEWKALMTEGAFNQTFLTGAEFAKWLGDDENRHRTLMQDAGLLGAN